ncbi:hypothetical protein ACFLV5_03780 [Chloroflexota bacterium]
MGETVINILMVVVLVGLLVANVYFKKRKGDDTPLGKAASILLEMHRNEDQAANFNFHYGMRKFTTGSWKKYKDKIDYLPQELVTDLAQTFDMVEDVNRRIDAARTYKSDSYLAGIDVSKLTPSLANSKAQLQEWLQENLQNPEYAPKRRGLFGL